MTTLAVAATAVEAPTAAYCQAPVAATATANAREGRRIRQISDMVATLTSARSAPSAATKSDRRWALRKRTDMPGMIGHAKNPQGLRCIVRNTSSSGALIEVSGSSDRFSNPAEDIPNEITLVFVSYKERTEVSCVVMRRAGRMFGVRYVGPFRSFPAPASSNKIVTQLKKR